MGPFVIIFSNLGLGGIQKKIVDIANALTIHPQLKVYILLRKRGAFDLQDQIENKNVTVLVQSQQTEWNIPFIFSFFILYQLWKIKPVTVLTFLSPFSLPTIVSKILLCSPMRIVINEDHFTSGKISQYRYALLNRIGTTLLYPRANTIISPTVIAKKDLVHNFGVPEQNILVIPNWTNLANAPILKRKKLYDCVYSGRLVPQKRVGLLIDAITQLRRHNKHISFCLLGQGEEETRLKALVAKRALRGNVHMEGAVHKVDDYVRSAKVFICASSYGAEGFPLAILEAMALGVPVLTRRFAGASEVIVDGRNGLIADSKADFASKLQALLANQALRNKLAIQAKKDVKNLYSQKNIIKYFHALNLS